MSIEREKGYEGDIAFFCDVCGADYDTSIDDFHEALEIIKSKGWRIKKIGDEWVHYCSQECLKD